jgi:hypothetical protein
MSPTLMDRRQFTRSLLAGAALTALGGRVAAARTRPARLELTHPAAGHGVHVSAPALIADRGGQPLVAWIAGGHGEHSVMVVRPSDEERQPVRVNPAGMSVDSLHQAPGLAVGPGGEVYVTWSAAKPKPEGVLFASDLYLSRSLDGGRTFEPPLRINDDRPISHSFEGLAVTPDGTVLVVWIDSRDGARQTATYVGRVLDRGARVERVIRLEGGETCVCCRVSISAGPGEAVGVLWRMVFPGDVRDMVLSRSADGGRTFEAATLVHADRWKITACPHRGGQLARDARGRLYAAWYTEGTTGRPDVLLAVAADGRRFDAPRRVHTASGSVPDHPRLAVGAGGRGVVVWEDSTAVRRRILLRSIGERGALGPVRTLSSAIKAWAPDVVPVDGGFLVAWHEERFPAVTTVVQRLAMEGGS